MEETKKYLFIDRDGTLIEEPADEQIDSIDKLRFVTGAITQLSRIAHECPDYHLVLVSNQDGLGTPAYPLEQFEPLHRLVMQTFAGEGVHFEAEHIDRTFEADHAPTRKPGTAMLTAYLNDPQTDWEHSYVIGDRATDRQLAEALGCNALIVGPMSWQQIADIVIGGPRRAHVHRTTAETDIDCHIDLDGTGQKQIDTGIGFFDHMLEQIPRHAGIDLFLTCHGDLRVDEHHTIEDCAIVLGECLLQALGSKRGLQRYGFCLPMDDCEAHVSLDLGGRPWLQWSADFHREAIGGMPTEMFPHFFKSLSDSARMNLVVRATGQNEHHKIESIFKAFARALRIAVARDTTHMVLPSSKGVL